MSKALTSAVLLALVGEILSQYEKDMREFTYREIIKKLEDTPEFKKYGIFIGPSYTIYDYLDELKASGIIEEVDYHRYKFKMRS